MPQQVIVAPFLNRQRIEAGQSAFLGQSVARAGEDIARAMFQYQQQAEAEKERQLRTIEHLATLSGGLDKLGPVVAKRYENLNGAGPLFPRDANGDPIVPVSPAQQIERAKAAMLQDPEQAKIAMGLVNPAPNPEDLAYKNTQADLERKQHELDRLSKESIVAAELSSQQELGAQHNALVSSEGAKDRALRTTLEQQKIKSEERQTRFKTKAAVGIAAGKQAGWAAFNKQKFGLEQQKLQLTATRVALQIQKDAATDPSAKLLFQAANAAARSGDKTTSQKLAGFLAVHAADKLGIARDQLADTSFLETLTAPLFGKAPINQSIAASPPATGVHDLGGGFQLEINK